jgi:hypothetical protein
LPDGSPRWSSTLSLKRRPTRPRRLQALVFVDQRPQFLQPRADLISRLI